jgi:gamma-glutamylcyclotransferase (GGCT)/AIG2-like uncharacterized protein YtfP
LTRDRPVRGRDCHRDALRRQVTGIRPDPTGIEPTLHTYFSYGSNLNRFEMRRRCPDARGVAAARLDGWRLAFRGIADIEPEAGRAVHGALWMLTDRDLESLDRYEGAPTHYRRRVVEVATADGPRTAIAYAMTDRRYIGLPSPLYLERIVVGFRHWGLPEHSLAQAVHETRLELERRGEPLYGAGVDQRLRAELEAA